MDGWMDGGAPVPATTAPDPHPPAAPAARWRPAASPSLGVARHTTPHRSLLLRWPSTTAHLRRDLRSDSPSLCLRNGNGKGTADMLDHEVENQPTNLDMDGQSAKLCHSHAKEEPCSASHPLIGHVCVPPSTAR